jgi:hypothetical protein
MMGSAMSWTAPDIRAARRTGSEPQDGVPVAAVRTVVFSALGTGLALTGHHLVSGHPVPWRAVLLAAGLLFGLTLPAARRVRSLPVVANATGAAQGFLHLCFVRSAGTPPPIRTPRATPSAPMGRGTPSPTTGRR